jgi:hypothetical protein
LTQFGWFPGELSRRFYLASPYFEAREGELTATIACENYRALRSPFGIESDGFSKGSFCALPVRPAH